MGANSKYKKKENLYHTIGFIMDYKNKDKVRKLIHSIEVEEKNLVALENAKDDISKNTMWLQVDDMCNATREFHCEVEGELKEYIISTKTKIIKGNIDRLKKELEGL